MQVQNSTEAVKLTCVVGVQGPGEPAAGEARPVGPEAGQGGQHGRHCRGSRCLPGEQTSFVQKSTEFTSDSCNRTWCSGHYQGGTPLSDPGESSKLRSIYFTVSHTVREFICHVPGNLLQAQSRKHSLGDQYRLALYTYSTVEHTFLSIDHCACKVHFVERSFQFFFFQ